MTGVKHEKGAPEGAPIEAEEKEAVRLYRSMTTDQKAEFTRLAASKNL